MNRATPAVAVAVLALLLTLLPISLCVDVALAGQSNGTSTGLINGESTSQDPGDPDDLDSPSPPGVKFPWDSIPPGAQTQAVNPVPDAGGVPSEVSGISDAAWQTEVALRLLSILF